jgi:hypothetical protein
MLGDGKTYGTQDGGNGWHVLLATMLGPHIHFADGGRHHWKASAGSGDAMSRIISLPGCAQDVAIELVTKGKLLMARTGADVPR